MTNYKYLQHMRLVVAILCAIFCIAGFWLFFYPIKIFDINLAPLLQRVIVDFSIFAFILLVLLICITAIFGRVYCSTICPLGLFQELCLLIFHRKQLPLQKNQVFKYFMAAIFLGTLLSGTSYVARAIDPYTIFGSAISGITISLIILGIIALLTGIRGRWFCTNICPIGAILGIISKHAYHKISIDTKSCVACGLCARKCPAGCIDFKNKTVNNETCIKCFKCLTLCHKQGLNYGHKTVKTPSATFNPQRRKFLISAALVATITAAYKTGLDISHNIAQKAKTILLPPGAGNAERFVNKCLNCNLCIENCPMKILKKANKDFPAVHIEYNKSFCDYNCNKCSQICPSGAISRLNLTEKQKIQIGVAVINSDACVRCGLCVRQCPRSAITKPQGEFPQVNPSICIGCGACQAACPVSAISITPLSQKTLT